MRYLGTCDGNMQEGSLRADVNVSVRKKGEEKLVQAITKVKNCMTELSSLANKHGIEASLFHTSNLSKIFQIG